MRLPFLIAVVFVAACGGATSETAFGTWTPPLIASPEVDALERQMWRRVNADRARAGKSALDYDARLSDVARAHSLDMRDHGFFDHVSPHTGDLERRLDVAGYLALEMRENLALAPTVDRAEDNLLKSPGHHANIMADEVTHVGIGIVQSDRGLFATQVFARPAKVQSPAEVEAAVRKRFASLPRAVPLQVDRRLEEMAADELEDLPAVVPAKAAIMVGRSVVGQLEHDEDNPFGAVAVAVQSVFGGDDFEPPDSASAPRSRFYGLAVGKGHDDRGRPRVRVLVLVAQPR